MTLFSATKIIFIAICLVGVALAVRPGRQGGLHYTVGNCYNCTYKSEAAACSTKPCFKKQQVSNPGDKDFSCTPGTSFKNDCNTCTCSPDGRNAACTLRACLKKREARGQSGQPGYCTPGESFQQDCNSCTCTQDGTSAYCTEKACIHQQRKRGAPGAQPGEDGYCTPGQSFKNDCNSCTCTSDGRNAYCTLMACLPTPNRPVRNAPAPRPNTPGFTCNPGAQFQDDCNSCTCSSDGKSAACTFKLCRKRRESPAPNTPGFTCTPGESFKYQCNTCKCGSNGKIAACTYAACPPGSYRRRRETPLCQDNETKQEDCNTCRCAQGQWACTRKACPKSKREDPVEKEFNGASCAPNDKFKIDCNTCYCNSDGSGYSCTEKLCASASSTQT